jgi:tRNA (guanine37-N1)-methyltransferase
MNSAELPEIFRPPINRSMQILDRSFFHKVIPLSAASISDPKEISNVRKELDRSGDILRLNPIKSLRDDELSPGAKCLLLRPGIYADRKSDGEVVWDYNAENARILYVAS